KAQASLETARSLVARAAATERTEREIHHRAEARSGVPTWTPMSNPEAPGAEATPRARRLAPRAAKEAAFCASSRTRSRSTANSPPTVRQAPTAPTQEAEDRVAAS